MTPNWSSKTWADSVAAVARCDAGLSVCVFHDSRSPFRPGKAPNQCASSSRLWKPLSLPLDLPAFSRPSRGAPEEGGTSSHPKAPPPFSTLRTTPSPFREAKGTEEGRSLEKTFPVGQRSDAVVCQQEIWETVGRGSRALRRKVSGSCRLLLF